MAIVGRRRTIPAPVGTLHDPNQVIRDILERARISQGLTRKALAEALGVHARTLRNWLAEPSSLDATQIQRLAEPLQLTVESCASLYQLTGHLPPPPSSATELQLTREIAVYKLVVDSVRFPSIVTDYAADHIVSNAPFRNLFGHVPPHEYASPLKNWLRYILFHPAAPGILGGGNPRAFRDYWLMPALANFIKAWQQHPADPKLLAIQQGIRRRPALRRAYEVTPDWIHHSGDIHVNSSARPLLDPRTGKLGHVHVVTEGHHGYQPLALTHVTFVLSEGPPATWPNPNEGALSASPKARTVGARVPLEGSPLVPCNR